MKRILLSMSLALSVVLALAPQAVARPKHEKSPKPASSSKPAKPPKPEKAPRAATPPKPLAPYAWVLSLHAGGGNLSMEGDSLGRDSGIMTQVRLEHLVAPGVVAGFQARGWSAAKSGLDRQLQILTVTAAGYPGGRGFYLRGGAGVCTARQQFLAPGALAAVWHQDGGFAATAAAGLDFRFRRTVGAGIDVEYARVVAAHIGGNLITYTVGLKTYW